MAVNEFIASCAMSDSTHITLYISATDSIVECTLQNMVDIAGYVFSMSVLMWQTTGGSIQIWC